jgi:phospholipid transport system transporter-binding protein
MTKSSIEVTESGFRVRGHVSFNTVLALRLRGEKILASAPHSVEIDLSDMKEGDASSLALLLSWMRYAKKEQRTLIITHASAAFLRMQKMFGLTDIMTI